VIFFRDHIKTFTFPKRGELLCSNCRTPAFKIFYLTESESDGAIKLPVKGMLIGRCCNCGIHHVLSQDTIGEIGHEKAEEPKTD